jgi:hypothetical protein
VAGFNFSEQDARIPFFYAFFSGEWERLAPFFFKPFFFKPLSEQVFPKRAGFKFSEQVFPKRAGFKFSEQDARTPHILGSGSVSLPYSETSLYKHLTSYYSVSLNE